MLRAPFLREGVITMPKKEEFKQELKAELLKDVGEKFDGFKADVLEAIKQTPRTRHNPNLVGVVPVERPEDRRARKLRKERDEILEALEDAQDALDEGDYDEAESIIGDVLSDYEATSESDQN
jgi:hypothetical protein